MESNKLIAEFMGIPSYKQGRYLMFEYADNNHRTEQDLAYHNSWDWLMPVVVECLTTGDRQHFVINDALLTCNIEEVHKAVVEFIKEYNDGCHQTYNDERQ